MTLLREVHGVHGFAEIAFDDHRIPGWMWKRVTVCTDTGCWEWDGQRDVNPARVMAMRLLSVEWKDIFAVTQTCANKLCCNPSHLCVTLSK